MTSGEVPSTTNQASFTSIIRLTTAQNPAAPLPVHLALDNPSGNSNKFRVRLVGISAPQP
jgi:hypothetical protein